MAYQPLTIAILTHPHYERHDRSGCFHPCGDVGRHRGGALGHDGYLNVEPPKVGRHWGKLNHCSYLILIIAGATYNWGYLSTQWLEGKLR